jgi:hypothetical protein
LSEIGLSSAGIEPLLTSGAGRIGLHRKFSPTPAQAISLENIILDVELQD